MSSPRYEVYAIKYAHHARRKTEIFSGAYEIEEVAGMVRRVYAGRVHFHAGDAEIAPGISLHLIGGHTMGIPVARAGRIAGAHHPGARSPWRWSATPRPPALCPLIVRCRASSRGLTRRG